MEPESDFENGVQSRRLENRGRNSLSHSRTSLEKFSSAITNSMETFFYRWGFFVATHPWKVIVTCLAVSVLLGLGLLNLSLEDRPDRLVIPSNSETSLNVEWMRKNFPPPIRPSYGIVTADNVLIPEVMRFIIDIHKRVRSIVVFEEKKYEDICYKLPITKFGSNRRKRRSYETSKKSEEPSSNDFDDDFFKDDEFNSPTSSPSEVEDEFGHLPSVPDEVYCSILNSLDDACWEINPTELWSFDQSLIYNLTKDDIIHGVNHQLISPIFGRKVNYTIELGGTILRNEKGEIISAGSVILRWIIGVNQTAIKNGEGINAKTGDVVDKACFEWERLWILAMKDLSANAPPGIGLYFGNFRSWGDLNEEAFRDDLLYAVVGFVVMCLYVGIMFGRWDKVDQRPYLTMAGLFCVLLALIGSCGLMSIFSVPFGLINRALPMLLLGVGVDDIFVLMQNWNLQQQSTSQSTKTAKNRLSIPERMGNTLKHAGVSITLTSITDITAFSAGATTRIDGLRFFCLYAAAGIAITFLLQITFFVAWFAIDQERIEDCRNAYFPWIKYNSKNYVQKTVSKSYVQRFFDQVLAKYLFLNSVKVFVMLLTGVLLAINLYGNSLLRQEFNPMWFIPDSSYFGQWAHAQEKYYPGTGYPGFVVAHNVNYTDRLNSIDQFVDEFANSGSVYNFDDWFGVFKEYSNKNFGTDIPNRPLTPKKFQRYLGKFLYSPYGSRFRPFFKLQGNFSCGDDLPPIETVITQFSFMKFDGPNQPPDRNILGMNQVKSILKDANLTFGNEENAKTFLWSPGLVAWEGDEIVRGEMYRNVALSLFCVLAVTLILLANLRVCFLCGVCVIFTIINVGGVMHWWGLTLDMVSCSCLIIAIGLCVDFAAHIGLAFMTSRGSKEQRAKEALRTIGPAVGNGGFSTLLAISFLFFSQSHAFLEFFKIFSCVVVFGLFHGLVFLPIVLSIIGPDESDHVPRSTSSSRQEGEDEFVHDIMLNEIDKAPVPKPIESFPLSRGSS